MKQLTTTGIVLQRTNYGEADRIVTILTPDLGKLRLVARGVRRVKAKLAGGSELFSVSSITFIKGRGELGTLISARLDKHYHEIAKDLDRTMLGYDLIKQLNRFTEDQAEMAWFELLNQALGFLNDKSLSLDVIRFWFASQVLLISGYTPNLNRDGEGGSLSPKERYRFDENTMAFIKAASGPITPNHIKLLRLGFSGNSPKTIQKIEGVEKLIPGCIILLETMLQISINR